jgi:photosystem II stability/assembly factor-like uncharacterized protein/PKD repeat protein
MIGGDLIKRSILKSYHMKCLFTTISLLLVLQFQSNSVFAQSSGSQADTTNFPYWIQMMQEPDANFYSTVSAFEKYWNSRPITKGCGWKVFKRWEYINSSRVLPNGKLPAPGAVAEEYLRYKKANYSLNGTWSQAGPVALPSNSTGQPNGMGRVNAIGFHPTDANTFYIGSPSGGLWKTTDGGVTWTLLSAGMPTLGVSAVLVHPTQPNIVWIGTGDRDAGDAPGMGVYKSTDSGTTWTVSNSGMGNLTVGMLIIHPSDPNFILAATSSGIYKTTNGGSTWTRKSSNTNSYKDIEFKPNDPTIVYATANGSFYRSSNSGDTWTQVTSGIISGSRSVIGVTNANPNYVYLMQTNGVFAGIMRSTDSGLNFTTMSTAPNIMDYNCDGSGTASQASYDLCIAVDPSNANTLYLGGVNIWKSTDGGTTLTINSHWVGSSWGTSCAPSVHADIHTLDFGPVSGKLYTGCDGGVYSTSNGGTSWTDLSSGLAIAQVYKIGQSATNSAYTMNGYQDNGTSFNNNSAFTTVIGGDGMECVIDYTNSNYRYGALYYGDIRKSTGGGYSTIAANGTNGINESGAWVTPYMLHKTNPNCMFAGYKNVWRSVNVKTGSPVSWTAISTGENSNCIVLEQSSANLNILYVVRSGSLKRTDNANDGTVTWTTCALPGGYTPTDLESHPTNADIIYATAQYGVYKSIDRGATWTNISGTLPAIYTNCLVYDKNSSEGIYVGNETAIYYKDASLSDWIPFSSGLPVVDVRELEIYYDASVPSNNRIKAATYGRGLWASDLFETGIVNPTNLAATPATDTQINLSWTKNVNNNNVLLVWSPTSTIGVPVPGTGYAAGSTLPGGGTVIYSGSNTTYSHTSLIPGTAYYYKAWSYSGTNIYSYGIGVSATTYSAPVAAFTVSNASPTLSVVVTLTDQSTFAPTSWAWSISPATFTFMNGTNANSQNPQVQFSALGQYTVTLTATNTFGSDLEIKTNYINVISCSYCATSYSNLTDDYISNVALNTISNPSGSTTYSDFTSLSTNLLVNSSNNISVSVTVNGAWVQHCIAWVDWNKNCSFADEGETYDLGQTPGTAGTFTLTGTITVPENASLGATRMRIAEKYNANPGSCEVSTYGEAEDYTINCQASSKSLNLTVFLEGLFSSSIMNKAQNASGNQFTGTIADQITVELHNSTSPYALAGGPYTVDINTDGTASVTIPGLLNSTYYVVVKHRNSIETWSGVPLSFSGSAVSHNFTTAASQSFGNNLKLVSGKYVIYSGDVNQDGIVDSGDMTLVNNAVNAFSTGYIPSDVNGDGITDSADMLLLDNNASLFIVRIKP